MCLTEKTEKKLECHSCSREFPRKKMEICFGCGGYYCEDCISWEYGGFNCRFCHYKKHIKYFSVYFYSYFCDECFNRFEYKPEVHEDKDRIYCSKCKKDHKCDPGYDCYIEKTRVHNQKLIDACHEVNLGKIKNLFRENKDQKCGYCLYISLMDKNLDIAEFFLKKGTWLDPDSIRSILDRLNSLGMSYGKRVLGLFIKYDVDFENNIYVLESELKKYVLKILRGNNVKNR